MKCGEGIIKKEIYFDFQEDKKINLILAEISSKIIYYKIASAFELFME